MKLIIQIKHAAYYVVFWIHTKFHGKKFKNNLTLARISVFHKLLIKVVIYSLVYNSFLWKGLIFLYINLTFAHFTRLGKDPVFNASFTLTHLQFFLWSLRTHNKNSFSFLNFFYCFYTLVKGMFFNNGVNCVTPWWHWSISEPFKEI